MIPKIIHYSWFSDDPIPEDIQRMMASWKKILPDYELRLWDGKALAELDLPFAHEAASVKKWAFASDQLRIYVVYTFGGIWLDTDVEVFKSFDPFLKHRMFIGYEDGTCQHFGLPNQLLLQLSSHCFGAEAGHPFLKRCLDYYEGRHFITGSDMTLPIELWQDHRVLPDIQALLAREFGYDGHPYSLYDKEVLKDDIHVYPAHYFDGPKYHSTEDVVCIHQRSGGWHDEHNTLPRIMKRDLNYYLHRALTSFLQKRGIFMKLYYVGHPK